MMRDQVYLRHLLLVPLLSMIVFGQQTPAAPEDIVERSGSSVVLVIRVVGSAIAEQNLNFAVPLESIAGLANGTGATPLGSGTSLRSPQTKQSRTELKSENAIHSWNGH